MSSDAIALLERASRSVWSGEVAFRDWMWQPSESALVARTRPTGGWQLAWDGAGPFQRPSLASRHAWFVYPEQLRIELLRGESVVRVGVLDGPSWWYWDAIAGIKRGTSGPEGETLPPILAAPLLWPQRLLSSFRFGPATAGTFRGRAALLAQAWPHQRSPRGVLSYEFIFDAEHGTVLRRVARLNGRRFHVTEAFEFQCDQPIETSRFAFDSALR